METQNKKQVKFLREKLKADKEPSKKSIHTSYMDAETWDLGILTPVNLLLQK